MRTGAIVFGIFIIAVSLSSVVSANQWWNGTVMVTNTSQAAAPSTAMRAFDSNVSSYWSEVVASTKDEANYEWNITIDLGKTVTTDAIRIFTDADAVSSDDGAPCNISVIRLCDDKDCIGDGTAFLGNCSMGITLGWYNCSITSATGRYLMVRGGVRDTATSMCMPKDTGSGDEMLYMYEIQYYTLGNPDVQFRSPENITYNNTFRHLSVRTGDANLCNYSVANSTHAAWEVNTSFACGGPDDTSYVQFNASANEQSTVYIWARNSTTGLENNTMSQSFYTSLAPIVIITGPENTTFNHTALHLSTTTRYADLCNYSLDNWATNTTFACGVTTAITSKQGQNNLLIWAKNSTSLLVNQTANISFTVTPWISISAPSNITYNHTLLTMSTTIVGADVCNYSVKNSTHAMWAVNTSFACGANTNIIFGDNQQSMLLVWAKNVTTNQIFQTNVSLLINSRPPDVTITAPANQTYNHTNLSLSAVITRVDICNYSIQNSTHAAWAVNTSFACSLPNDLRIIAAEGQNTIWVWARNLSGNTVNQSSYTSFVVDTITPAVSITGPLNQSYHHNALYLSTTITGGADLCNYTFDNWATNNSFACGVDTAITIPMAQTTLMVWAKNSTSGRVNQTSNVSFTAETPIGFSIALNSPADGNTTANQNQTFNFTVSGDAASYSCELLINGQRANRSTPSWVSNLTLVNGSLTIRQQSTASVFFRGGLWNIITGGGATGISQYHNGSFWNGNTWIFNASLYLGLPVSGFAAPEVFFRDGAWHIIEGNSTGTLVGYDWNTSSWVRNASLVNGTINYGSYSTVSVFFRAEKWHMVVMDQNSVNGSDWNGNTWVYNKSLVNGSITVSYSNPTIFLRDGAWNMLLGSQAGTQSGYSWNSNTWILNDSLANGLIDYGAHTHTTAFFRDGLWHLFILNDSGPVDGLFGGFDWVEVAPGIQQMLRVNATLANNSRYTWQVNCSVEDVTNASEIRTITIGTPPTTLSVSISGPSNQTYNHTALHLSTTITGADVCNYSLDNWATNVSFTCNSETAFTASWGQNTLRVWAKNLTDGGVNASQSVSFTANSTPVITRLDWSPSTAYAKDNALMCNATAVDYFNSTLLVEYVIRNGSTLMWTGNKSVSNNSYTNIFTIEAANLSDSDVWNCTVRARDGDVSPDPWNSSVITVLGKPSVTIAGPGNTTFNHTGLHLSPTITRADLCNYSLDSWATNTTFTCTDASTAITASEGQNILWVWAKNVSSGMVNQTESVSFTVDLPPWVTYVGMLPSPALDTDTLECNVTAQDNRNSTLIVEYNIFNGTNLQYWGNVTGVANNTRTKIFIVDNASGGENWNCSIRAWDSVSYSGPNWNSSNVSIVLSNAAPVVSFLSLQPATVYPSSSLDCNVTAVDNENSTLIVEYNIFNGTTLKYWGNKTNVANNTKTILFTINNLSEADTWNCTVRANDGTAYSSPWNSTTKTVSVYSVAIGLSLDMSKVPFGSLSVDSDNNTAEGNNGAGTTDYSVQVATAEGTMVDLYIMGLSWSGESSIGIGNMSLKYNTTDDTVPSEDSIRLTSSFSDTKIAAGLSAADNTYLKFWLDVPAGTPAGDYNTTLSVKAVVAGQSP